MPEISIAWWDVVNNKKAMARLPSRTFQILAGSHMGTNSTPFPDSSIPYSAASESLAAPKNPLIFAIIACLAVLLLAAVFWVITLQRKILKLSGIAHRSQKEEAKSPNPQNL